MWVIHLRTVICAAFILAVTLGFRDLTVACLYSIVDVKQCGVAVQFVFVVVLMAIAATVLTLCNHPPREKKNADDDH